MIQPEDERKGVTDACCGVGTHGGSGALGIERW